MRASKDCLAESIQKLFQTCNKRKDNPYNLPNVPLWDAATTCDGDTDFVIKSMDGDSFNVHSWVLKLRKTDFFDNLFRSDFKEKKERTLHIPAASLTVELFVKFLYGFELDEDIPLFIWKELIQIGGVYDRSVQVAATDIMMKHLEKSTVFGILAFCKLHEVRKAVEVCRTFIAMNFEPEYLIKKGHFDGNPETAVEILKIKAKKQVNTYTIPEAEPRRICTRRLNSQYRGRLIKLSNPPRYRYTLQAVHKHQEKENH